MKTLLPSETNLIGEWNFIDGKITGNEACERIEYLVSNVLKEVSKDATGWDILYRDPQDNRYWELIYPQSHMHGGGPPQLRCLTLVEVKAKYSNAVAENQ